MKPSHWSHAVLIASLDEDTASTPIFEIALEPAKGFVQAAPTNGLQTNEIGAYDDEAEAVRKTAEQHEIGTFLVQKCEPGTESYTQVFHSLVAFD